MIGYNRITGYNKARYNAEGVELSQNDGISLTDAGLIKSSQKTQTELIILADTQAKQQNKSVTETIRLDDWARYKEDQANLWSD